MHTQTICCVKRLLYRSAIKRLTQESSVPFFYDFIESSVACIKGTFYVRNYLTAAKLFSPPSFFT